MFETKFLDDYKGFGKCLYMTNGVVDVIASLDIGPRILRYGYVGEDNIFIADTENKCIVHQSSPELKDYYGSEEHYYCTYGGHRIWQAPEVHPKTHYPDNFPIEYEILENGVKLTAPVQYRNNIQCSITLTFGEETEVNLHQEIKNTSRFAQDFALWTITMCATGGVAVMRRNDLSLPGSPNMSMALWSHANFTNNTIFIGNKYITVVQPKDTSMKFGLQLQHGDTYYVNGDTVFKKEFAPKYPYGNYTDWGSNFETYSCAHFTELEFLSEYQKVAPGNSVALDESWSLCRKPCDFDPKSDASIDNFFSKL